MGERMISFTVFDRNGRITLDLTKNLTRFKGKIRLTKKEGDIALNKQPSERVFAFVTIPTSFRKPEAPIQPFLITTTDNGLRYVCQMKDIDLANNEFWVVYGIY